MPDVSSGTDAECGRVGAGSGGPFNISSKEISDGSVLVLAAEE